MSAPRRSAPPPAPGPGAAGGGPDAGGRPDPSGRRTAALARLADEPWDLLVVGGGVVGAGAFLDAVSRGLRVALVEQDDLAAGTSSRSSRLIHGGLRYLEQRAFALVREALRERERLLRLAPHLVRLERFLFPLYGPPFVPRLVYGTGLTLYDLLGAARSGGRHRALSGAEALEYAPDLVPDGLRGGLLYTDGMEDDARLVVALVRTALARSAGAAIALTGVRATGPVEEAGRVVGAVVEVRPGGARFAVRAAAVLDATGVWGALPDRPFPGGSFEVLPSRGTHLVVPRERIRARGGVTLRIPGRTAFLVPWPRHWVIGTTDRPYRGPIDRVAAAAAEVDEILATVNGAFACGLTRDDVVGTYAGLRPLVARSDAASTVRVSREHRVSEERPGLVRVSGGKYTTYRVMARDAVDAVLGPAAAGRPSATAELPLAGAAPRRDLGVLAARLVREAGLDAEVAASLVDRHGTEAPAVVSLGRALGLGGRLVASHPFIEAEVAWGVVEECAGTLDDLLARRMRLVHELRDRGAAVAPRVAEIAGGLLGWDPARRGREVAAYLEGARREYGVPGA